MSEPKSVLIIDDDPDFVHAVGELLASSGYQVSTASNGREGLDLAKRLQPDLILLDVMMSERTEGFFTLEQIRDVPALAETPVIVISSIYSDHPVFKVSPEAGWLPASLFLPKPVDPARLIAESARLIAASAATGAHVPQAGSSGR
jgi:two-component system alkaline phosphatase synthesis response regulator PhoP